jgi:hypothetical protein
MDTHGTGPDKLQNDKNLPAHKQSPQFLSPETAKNYTVQRLTLPSWRVATKTFMVPTALCDDRFFQSDMEKYPAARSAIFDAARLVSWRYGRQIDEISALIDFPDDLKNWRRLFSPTGYGYTNLNKTLDAAESHPITFLLPYLAFISLNRPITSQLELSFLLMIVDFQLNDEPDIIESRDKIGECENVFYEGAKIREFSRLNLFQKATESEIGEAMHIYGKNTGDTEYEPILGFLTGEFEVHSVANFLSYLEDYKDSEPTNLVSLTKRAVRWHDQLARRERKEIRCRTMVQYGDLSKPVPVPRFDHRCPNLRFLSTLEEICDEAEHMQHCVDMYIEEVLNGKCHIFHLDLDGSEATVEFDFAGILIQAKGPKNRNNAAVEFAIANFKNPYKF